MTILDALKADEFKSLRVIKGSRWLVGHEDGLLIVYEQKVGQKFSRVIVETNVEEIAVKHLLNAE